MKITGCDEHFKSAPPLTPHPQLVHLFHADALTVLCAFLCILPLAFAFTCLSQGLLSCVIVVAFVLHSLTVSYLVDVLDARFLQKACFLCEHV